MADVRTRIGTQSTASPKKPVSLTDRCTVRLDSIQQQLYAILRDVDNPQAAFDEFTLIAAELTSAECSAYFQTDGAGRVTLSSSVEIACNTRQQPLSDLIIECSIRATSGKPIVTYVEKTALVIVAVPVMRSARQSDAIVVVLNLANADVEPFVVSLQLVSTYVTLWYQHKLNSQLDWEAEATAAVVELVAEVENSDSQRSACMVAANKLQSFLSCQQVAIGFCGRAGGSRLKLQAISGAAEFDSHSESTQLLEDVLNEVVVRDGVAVWPAARSHAILAHRKLGEMTNVETVISIPMRTVDGELIGACTISGCLQGEAERVTNFLDSASPFVANALKTARNNQTRRLHRLCNWLTRDQDGWRLKVASAVVLAILLIMLIPLKYKISCDCELEPLSRRFGVAPYDGVLQDTFVKPGDVVQKNQLLARMDDRELQWELSGLLADRDRAAKKRDTSLSEHDVPSAQMEQLEVDRLELKLRLLKHRMENLEIRSVTDGIVLDGDLEGAKGAPVKIGEPLFEIAALDELRLEVAVPEEELPHLETGMSVFVKLDGLGTKTLEGTVHRVRPRGEIRSNDNVFVAEVVLANDDGSLRPGMSGHAKVVARRHTLTWIVFHRAWERVLRVFI